MTLFALRLPHGLTLFSAYWSDLPTLRVLACWVGTRCFTWRLP